MKTIVRNTMVNGIKFSIYFNMADDYKRSMHETYVDPLTDNECINHTLFHNKESYEMLQKGRKNTVQRTVVINEDMQYDAYFNADPDYILTGSETIVEKMSDAQCVVKTLASHNQMLDKLSNII